MPSTYSTDLRIELIATGEQSGTWGTTTNTNLGTLIEDAISGLALVAAVSANQALTASNGAKSPPIMSRPMFIVMLAIKNYTGNQAFNGAFSATSFPL